MIEEINQLHVQICQSLADPTRILILRAQGLVTATREGAVVCYVLYDGRSRC